MQADFLWLCRNKVVAFAPSSAGRSGVAASSVLNEEAKIFTSTYGNFIQTDGIRDGASSHYAKILFGFYDNLDTSDINDPEVIIKIDISNVFNTRLHVAFSITLHSHTRCTQWV